ncbi:MHYT domain-containing protein [Wenzhouxiangella marina]|uniref:Uncharacterized protein n=1 Tax=Wenzhouxiangella marina TaxID=1579979 RepID=A0A0K0XS03_9GAMM|nr:MHYT domain-containing protein [Wenzhouxiangella marina]AKS40435.1 hypothetical protein WM2015_44 [Wenzhouxiangella marina]MBB6088243.1 NO-binding membrane sensor protein with MHYT domain [Wenzhouxiangella marina]
MEGSYALPVVALSYIVAVIAAYTALEMAGKVLRPQNRPTPWILAGSVAFGTGIWSMHFIGMEAFDLPIDVVYDGPLTIMSWIAAVSVSGLALWTLALLRKNPDRPDPRIVIPAGLVMGAGICIMHYSGMAAMRIEPGIQYDPLLFSASVLIAVAASIVTLLIAARLRRVRNFKDVGLRLGAALVMGVAVCGMHYTGMWAASFAPDSICTTASGLTTGWTIGPITFATLAILASALVVSFGDTNAIRKRRAAERERSAVAEEKAFVDQVTGLPNRSWLNRQLTENAVSKAQQLTLVMLEHQGTTSADGQKEFAQWLRQQFPQAQAVCVQEDSFALLFYGYKKDAARQQVIDLMATRERGMADWKIGAAACPEDTERLFRLVPRARADVAAFSPA